jgi:CHAD domain-containing protein
VRLPARRVFVTTHGTAEKKSGLSYWMHQVLREADKAEQGFDPDAVHDLRVALRRCRSMAEGFQAVDPDSAWKKMRKAGKELFGSLGELRDIHVMMEWTGKLGTGEDPVTQRLLAYAKDREQTLKMQAAEALKDFDREQWETLAKLLSRRGFPLTQSRLRMKSGLFQCIALERWDAAHRLHRTAMKTRSKAGLHRLRIGVKKFRYVVENFLPQMHEPWSRDLKEIQDLLGEVHDLDVLLETAVRIQAFPVADDRLRWEQRIGEERGQRIEKYRAKMTGQDSLWSRWRAGLPQGREAEEAVYKKLSVWAAFLDSDVRHSQRIVRLTLQLYDGLVRIGVMQANNSHERELLRAAVLVHDVGRSEGNANHHKATQRLVARLDPPFGWKQEDISMVSLIARYHRGALPGAQKKFLSLAPDLQIVTQRLAGVLRLADAMDRSHDGAVHRLKVVKYGDFVVVYADGLNHCSSMAETIAGARYLLEESCGIPVMVKPMAS